MPALMTAEELLYHDEPNKRTELVRGVLEVHEPPGGRHGRIASELGRRLGNHVLGLGLGAVYADSGFTLWRNPDTVRAPDVAFVRAERLLTPEPIGYPELGPDLVVEVLSPHDRPGKVLAKVADWLTAGTRLVWVIDPQRRHARVYRADGTEATVLETQALEGEDVIPGFVLELGPVL
ncbi:MAG TPA: Uma2 family endonuclease [Gemmatimonadales bacterium]|nr:Uma2 family endonuclease [Gemmatimonadales bacterium]